MGLKHAFTHLISSILMQSDAELLNFSTIYDVILNGEYWETFSELFQDKLLLFCAIGKIKFRILFKETWTLLGLE